MPFTMENTAGFTESELDALNAAMEVLLDGSDDPQFEKSMSDLLTNAWDEGVTADDLISAVRQLM